MTRDPRFDVLFEPVQIGPVTAKNRFYQVPHCCGMGFNSPQSHAKMQEMKAEGGWVRELDAAPVDPNMPFRREQIALASSV